MNVQIGSIIRLYHHQRDDIKIVIIILFSGFFCVFFLVLRCLLSRRDLTGLSYSARRSERASRSDLGCDGGRKLKRAIFLFLIFSS
jgi:hypothetical protein